ncbi:cytochrome c biogenesis protein ResB [Actinomadura sp. NBRC 104412]|uniref:cytochrome c biogenesis protein ResB n=1 Tax=Actinomadura sp. NBRC 104412 TaxID=3032203 RepID=UPI002553A176|nr:cytochrome c biogenesis protein ResB [Actinomadura sp. NBRC 104412]
MGWLRWGWRQLTTMRTALILLFLVALGAVPGSVLPQRGQAPERVAEYFEKHATLAPWFDRLSLFDVFAAPWFAAIYILLFVSLAGCVIPRAFQHYKAMRARPPAAPRNLLRLPQSASFETDAEPEAVLAEARKILRKRRFRVDGGVTARAPGGRSRGFSGGSGGSPPQDDAAARAPGGRSRGFSGGSGGSPPQDDAAARAPGGRSRGFSGRSGGSSPQDDAAAREQLSSQVDSGAVSAEKGYLGETGNLVFHLALLALLFALGMGNVFGYRGNVVVSEGKSFANALSYYDQFTPGRRFDTDRLPPFSLTLDDFKATYQTQGVQRGQATDYQARLRFRETPSSPEKPYNLRVNHPLSVGGAKVYLLNHGYAPVFTVRDAKGNIAFQDSVPFLPMEQRNYTSEGVVKVPDAEPEQLAFYAILWPTAVADQDGKQIVSGFPAPLRPVVTISSFKGDIGLDTGNPQSVYKLEGIGRTLHPVKGGQKLLEPGETFTLPGGAGSITFDGMREWASLSVNHDPGRMPALVAAVLAIVAIVASFMVRRRRVWVRARAGEGGRTVVEAGGLTLGNPTPEFDEIVAALRGTVVRDERPERDPATETKE